MTTKNLLSWNNLTITANRKNIISQANGYISSGLCAIMGHSGSGKTTLLSALAKRVQDNKMNISGDLLLNNQQYNHSLIKKISGYVMQDDIVHSYLTVYETLKYIAELKMHTTNEKLLDRVEYIINKMDLINCRDNIIGNIWDKGISGGERKRLCIAIELLTNPKILFLDEPTSGLDSMTAYNLIISLKQLADEGCMVIITIHQPSNDLVCLFDNLILMKTGSIYYNGPVIDAINYITTTFNQPNINYSNIMLSNEINIKPKIIYTLIDISVNNQFEITTNQSWYRECNVLFRRNIKYYTRNVKLILFNIISTIIVSFFTCSSVWNNIGTHKSSVPLRQAVLFFCVIHQGIISSLQGTHSFPLERIIMLKERKVGTYNISAYFIAKIFADMIFQIIYPIIFTCITYYNIGLQPDVSKFFIFMSFMILASISATSLASMISCIFHTIELSTIILGLLYEISRLYGGWFISPKLMSIYPNWKFADSLSYIKYSFVGVSLNENNNLLITCLSNELTNTSCIIPPLNIPPYTGNAFNSYYGYNEYTISFCAGILLIYIFGCKLITYLALKYNI